MAGWAKKIYAVFPLWYVYSIGFRVELLRFCSDYGLCLQDITD